MRRSGGSLLLVLSLLTAAATPGRAQDTLAVMRHLLAMDVSRVHPYHRAYDMLVHGRDSTVLIGQRDVTLAESTYAGAPAWLVVETRTGVVPSVESLYVATDLRLIHWMSALGDARVGAEFAGDSIYGAATMQSGKQNLVLGGRPDLVVTSPMLEALLPLLPLAADWSDSVAVLGVDLTSTTIVPAELAVVAEEQLPVDSVTTLLSWVVALRTGSRQVLVWIDKQSGVALKVRQALPPHVGTDLEYRLRPEPASTTPPP